MFALLKYTPVTNVTGALGFEQVLRPATESLVLNSFVGSTVLSLVRAWMSALEIQDTTRHCCKIVN